MRKTKPKGACPGKPLPKRPVETPVSGHAATVPGTMGGKKHRMKKKGM